MTLSPADWILWIALLGGVALLWFVPHLPVAAASAAAFAVGAYIFYASGFEWIGAALLLFGAIGLFKWLYRRKK